MVKLFSSFLKKYPVHKLVESGRGSRDQVEMFTKILPMYLRGLWWKLWLASASAPIFIGKQVAICNPKYTVGGSFVAKDFCRSAYYPFLVVL